MSILLLEGGPNRKEYDLSAKKNTLDRPYSNRVSAVSKSSVQLLQSIGAWQIIEDLGRNNAVKEMRVSILKTNEKIHFLYYLIYILDLEFWCR